jgi:hypothetical protein
MGKEFWKLKKAIDERIQIMSDGVAGIRRSFELLFEKYNKTIS